MNQPEIRKVYTPYPTDQFQRCPTLWKLAKKWKPKPGGSTRKRDEAAVIGSAIALGLEVHYKQLLTPGVIQRDPHETAQAYLRANYVEGSSKSLKGMSALVQRGIELGISTDLGIKYLCDVERYFGNVKPDLVARRSTGELLVIDHKVKTDMEEKWLDRELQGYDTSNQFFHYAWAVGMEYGEPVTEVLVHMIVLAPNPRTYLHAVAIDPAHLAFWLQGVAETWSHMKDVEDGLPVEARFASCINKYGQCDFYDACHVYYGDESLFPAQYERVSYRAS